MKPKEEQKFPLALCGTVAGASAAVVCGTAAAVALSSRKAQRTFPPAGRFIDVAGVRVHYLDEGQGPPLVLIHGNAMSADDFVASDLVAQLRERYRVIVFDRPGFGYTQRPRATEWTPARQALLLHEALVRLDVTAAIVVGHSLGALVATALTLDHPEDVRALVLLSGYYYASMPPALPYLNPAALPLVGDVIALTVAPVAALTFGAAIAKKMFAPSPVSENFARYPHALARRPSQIRATTEDAKLLDAAARDLEPRYGELTLPVEILAGDGDEIVATAAQSERLARELSNARFDTIAGAGHMIHYIAPERVVAAIDAAERRSKTAGGAVAGLSSERSRESVVA